MVADLMGKLTPHQKEEVLAQIQAFDFSGIRGTLPGNICRYYQSFLGRDFKTWAQICLFIVWDFLTVTERAVWINLSKVHNVNYFIYALIWTYITLSQVFRVAYCEEFDPNNADNVRTICQAFVTSICDYNPEMLRKPKIHSILHLSDDMMDFGPTAV